MAAPRIPENERKIIWSRLPDLKFSATGRSGRARQDKWKVTRHQIGPWTNFIASVRNFTAHSDVFGQRPPTGGINSPVPRERYTVANESGVSGRFVQNVCHEVNVLCEMLGLPEFGDTQAGKGVPAGCSWPNVPDFIVFQLPKKTCLVAEVKTPWNTDLDNLGDTFELVWGQIVRYMDDCKCRYGILTAYNQTICICRNSDYTVLRSPTIRHYHKSTPGIIPTISVREAMLYMVFLAGNGRGDAEYPNQVPGITSGVWPPTRTMRDRA